MVTGAEPADVAAALRVRSAAVKLAKIDPRGTPGLPASHAARRDPKTWSHEQVHLIGEELESLQERLYANAKFGDDRRVLLVLQAMDCGGKDGTIRRVAGTMNPQGLHIVGFGKPTPEELSHDFLWRIRQALPPPGIVGVFNRSHYEDVLVARVEELTPLAEIEDRYEQINKFEAELVADGVTLVKVMLHISRHEQKKRLTERLTDPTKHWKYNPGDLETRAKWRDYQDAYALALGRCSTDAAPWYVVPADRKWYRNWAVAQLLRQAMTGMNLSYPPTPFDVPTERKRLAAAD